MIAIDDHTIEPFGADEYFAVIPETILYADISSNAVRCFAILQRYANADRQCWPGQAVLANKMRCSKDTIKRAIEELVTIGAIEVERRYLPNGNPTSNRYTLKMRVGANLHPPGGKDAPTLGANLHPKSKPKNQSQETTSSSTAVDGQFDLFWAIYPRKIGKGAALKAFKTATKTADPQTIIDHATLYAAQRAGQDPQYTCHPTTWLNQQRWLDNQPTTTPQLASPPPAEPTPCTNPECNNGWIYITTTNNTEAVTRCPNC